MKIRLFSDKFRWYFNPRSREGSDCPSCRQPGIWTGYFNPRSREGSDSTGKTLDDTDTDFNPRSREGSDPLSPICC